MTKEQAIEKLVDQINSDMAIFVGILAIVLAAFLYFQWRLSDKQIKKMKDETRQELEETYHFNEMRRDINGLNNNLKSIKKELDTLMDTVEKLKTSISNNEHDISKLGKLDNNLFNISEMKIDYDSIQNSMERAMIESEISSLIYSKDKEKSKELVNILKDKIVNIISSEKTNNIEKIEFLSKAYRQLKNSNNNEANKLGDILHENYSQFIMPGLSIGPVNTPDMGIDESK